MVNCLNCEHFTFWDGDWCCTARFILLSEIDKNTNKTVNPEACTKDRRTCSDYEEETWEPTLRFNRELWEEML